MVEPKQCMLDAGYFSKVLNLHKGTKDRISLLQSLHKHHHGTRCPFCDIQSARISKPGKVPKIHQSNNVIRRNLGRLESAADIMRKISDTTSCVLEPFERREKMIKKQEIMGRGSCASSQSLQQAKHFMSRYRCNGDDRREKSDRQLKVIKTPSESLRQSETDWSNASHLGCVIWSDPMVHRFDSSHSITLSSPRKTIRQQRENRRAVDIQPRRKSEPAMGTATVSDWVSPKFCPRPTQSSWQRASIDMTKISDPGLAIINRRSNARLGPLKENQSRTLVVPEGVSKSVDQVKSELNGSNNVENFERSNELIFEKNSQTNTRLDRDSGTRNSPTDEPSDGHCSSVKDDSTSSLQERISNYVMSVQKMKQRSKQDGELDLLQSWE